MLAPPGPPKLFTPGPWTPGPLGPPGPPLPATPGPTPVPPGPAPCCEGSVGPEGVPFQLFVESSSVDGKLSDGPALTPRRLKPYVNGIKKKKLQRMIYFKEYIEKKK